MPLNAIISSLEVLMVLLKDTVTFGQRSRNIKKCVERICTLAAEHFDNQLVTMPVIGTMLTLRDKNLGYTMDSLARLDPPILHKFELLARQHAPDLFQNIKDHVSQKILFGVDASDESSSRTNSLVGMSHGRGSKQNSSTRQSPSDKQGKVGPITHGFETNPR